MGFFDELKKATKEGIDRGKAEVRRKEEEELKKHIAICELQERERKERNKR